MLKKRLLLALCLCIAPLVAPARAVPFTSYFNDLLVELNTRLSVLTGTLTAQQKKDKASYTSLVKQINKKSLSLATDIKTAVNIIKTIDKKFPLDATLSALVDDLLAHLAGDVQDLIGDAEFDQLNMVPGTPKTQVANAIISANNFMIMSQSATTHGDRIKFVNNAMALVGKSTKLIKKAAKIVIDGTACRINGTLFKSDSSSFVLSPTQFDLVAHQNGNPSRDITIHCAYFVPFVSGSTHTLVPGSGTVVINLDGTPTTYVIDSGSLTAAVVDTVNLTVSGSYSFSAISNDGQQIFLNVSEGFFTTKSLQLQ
jgi:hypothetical protein